MNKVLILGNGPSRLNKIKFINNWDGEIWVCNYAFKEALTNNKISLVASVHKKVTIDAYDFKINNNLNYKILHNEVIEGLEDKVELFNNFVGYSTGCELINKALFDGYKKIVIMGFDSLKNSGEDIYCGNVVYVNFKNQIFQLIKKYKLKNVNLKKDIITLRDLK
jgi:hypothetical protein